MTTSQGKRISDPVARLESAFRVSESGCWEWQRPLNWAGYGHFRFNKRRMTAHRAAYTLLIGEIPEGLDLDHLCRNRACVNPVHLEPVTRAENLRRGEVGGWQRNKTSCKNGHPFDEANTYREPRGRQCRECRRVARLAYYHREKAS